MKYAPLGLWLVATPFLGPFLPTTIAAGIAGSSAAHTSDRGLRSSGGPNFLPRYESRMHVFHGADDTWSGRLIGQVDYENPSLLTAFVVLKLDTGKLKRGLPKNYYVWFNHQAASGTYEGKDQVMISRAGGAQSDLISKMSAGESHTIENFDSSRGVRVRVTLTVNSISAGFGTLYADITIGDGRPGDSSSCGTPPLQSDYRGRISVTKSGETCQAWSSVTPHIPFYTPTKNPLLGLAQNYCRNPDESSGGPWCYTTDPDVRFASCDVPDCADCGTPPLQSDYRGPISVTRSGKTCQAWSSQTPHAHLHITPEKYPLAGLADNNHCRNPDDESSGPWCYTTDPDETWDNCDVPDCAGETDAPAPDGGGAYAEN